MYYLLVINKVVAFVLKFDIKWLTFCCFQDFHSMDTICDITVDAEMFVREVPKHILVYTCLQHLIWILWQIATNLGQPFVESCWVTWLIISSHLEAPQFPHKSGVQNREILFTLFCYNLFGVTDPTLRTQGLTDNAPVNIYESRWQ